MFIQLEQATNNQVVQLNTDHIVSLREAGRSQCEVQLSTGTVFRVNQSTEAIMEMIPVDFDELTE